MIGRSWPAACVSVLSLLGQHGQFRILRPDGMVFEVADWRMVKGIAGNNPRRIVLFLIEEAEKILRRVDILREIPDAQLEDGRAEMSAGGSCQGGVMIQILGDRHLL